MPRNRYALAGGIIAFLLLANIVYYGFSDWGLITVKVQNAPLSQVIKSIEWQGWVKIYTNLPPDTKVSMYVDKVSLPEALETLSVNAGGRWGLGFFVGPSSANVKETIHSFEAGSTDDSLKTYNYPVMLGMLITSDDADNPMPTADPRLQTWPGIKAPVVPVSTNPAPPADSSIPSQPGDNQPAPTPPAPPDSVQGYLRSFAQAADIFIITNSSWDPPVAKPPPASSSIISAIRNFVSDNHGAVTEAFVLRARGPRGQGGGGFRRGFADGEDTGWDRMRNAINGLPEEMRVGALNQLDQESKFRKDVQAAPPDQRADMMRQHIQAKMADNGGPWQRMSPEQRAQRYQRMVANRMAAQGR
jgi:hypothetical protein